MAEAGLRFQTPLASPSKDLAPRLVRLEGQSQSPHHRLGCVITSGDVGCQRPHILEALPPGYLHRAQNDSGTSQGCGKVLTGGAGLAPL